MEPDRDGGDTQHAPAPADPVLTSTNASDHDSLVTVRLSEPPSLHLNTTVPPSTIVARKSPAPPDMTQTVDEEAEEDDDDDDDSESDIFEPETSASKRRPNLLQELGQAAADSGDEDAQGRQRRGSTSSSGSERVDWDELQRKEDLESKAQASANSTASLLAKLEQENDRIATSTKKSTKVKAATDKRRSRESKPRPPSMAQLRQMVNGPTPPALRYSTLPPTPLTELEFYLALVKDPKQTAARLPSLLANKVRKGVPPPLRGVVWQSMAGARDSALEALFERLSGESSPYEGVISKDLGRSFPGVDMFRDPDGDGQRMLGRVLKCFSLYDTKIGYCQGLAFLVGPLLMHMPDKQAFCVLVRLMENYDLRQCFVPDLSGLHIRIYQFRELLRQLLPALSAHLDDLQVEPAYVSQWFLSFFAVTCPLPMLFRIYDVIFLDGAGPTLMRVALSLMRKNQARILACTELEDVMHLLLSRGLWDCYNYNADDFVHGFVALSDEVTRERMTALEQGYREAKISSGANHRGGADAAQASADVTNAASRFLGRLWAASSTPRFATFSAAAAAAAPSSTISAPGSVPVSSSSNSNSTTLNPGLGAASRPLSMLRRSTSKHSLSSMEAVSSTTSSAASVLTISTEATTISRDSSADDPPREATAAAPFKPAPTTFSGGVNPAKDGSKHLHGQIEDLLTALSELQRNHALLASQLQREKEEREEDRRAVRSLLDGLRRRAGGDSDEIIPTAPTASHDDSDTTTTTIPTNHPTAEQLSDLLDVVELRFSEAALSPTSSSTSSTPLQETKSQLRDEVTRTREQLVQERARSRELTRKVQELEQEVASARERLRESHAHVRNAQQEKQRLERQIHGMRLRASDTPGGNTAVADKGGEWFSRGPSSTGASNTNTAAASAGGGGAKNGLRELKLGRSRSTPSQASTYSNGKRASSLMTMQLQRKPSSESLVAGQPPQSSSSSRLSAASTLTAPPPSTSSTAATLTNALTPPLNETDAILLELVQAKTAEAVARQELEEAKQKLEQLRKAFGLAPGETPPLLSVHNSNNGGGGSSVAAAMGGMFGRLTGQSAAGATGSEGGGIARAATTPPAVSGVGGGGANGGGGGFWGWRR